MEEEVEPVLPVVLWSQQQNKAQERKDKTLCFKFSVISKRNCGLPDPQLLHGTLSLGNHEERVLRGSLD
ncbi:hypothetical protein EYF80_010656 [Liparis tanakae]|uniref:Uncharacterized protein n=1 Tax=Liparis tanakae TaxID=230148 RepID=A0A4Z2IMI2_9TELE|nr:hypothetical protein EYF80_010656 [Liparis tanakae]